MDRRRRCDDNIVDRFKEKFGSPEEVIWRSISTRNEI